MITDTVDRPGARAAQAGEQLAGERRRARPNLFHAREHAGTLARRVEEPIRTLEHERALARRFLMPAQHLAPGIENLDLSRVQTHGDGAV